LIGQLVTLRNTRRSFTYQNPLHCQLLS